MSHLSLGPEHRILILASDGVWDVLSPEDAIDSAVTAVAEGRYAVYVPVCVALFIVDDSVPLDPFIWLRPFSLQQSLTSRGAACMCDP